MQKHLMVLAVVAAPAAAVADGIDGVWKTHANDAGGYLEITVGPCATDATKTCGVVSKAFEAGSEDPTYRYLGQPIIDNMTSDGDDRYSGGTVFDPESGKRYDSKLSLKRGALDVEGCVACICQGEMWSRVK